MATSQSLTKPNSRYSRGELNLSQQQSRGETPAFLKGVTFDQLMAQVNQLDIKSSMINGPDSGKLRSSKRRNHPEQQFQAQKQRNLVLSFDDPS